MGEPVISDLKVLYPEGRDYLLPGEVAEVTAVITDPDASQAEVTIVVTDSAGNVSSGVTQVALLDEIETTGDLRQMDYDAGWTITGEGSSYKVTAPAGTVQTAPPA